ncbi:MAG: 2-amino-4-hydroxy-6-hydroxymethyldihydropteridine diphosphokinase [Acidobacteria bacterium]|nr:2-amino-4-hydroxy-6-hydroxymethyldihydropteridine diphosphokinase [Acidobacteriota bacterium]
MPSNPVIAYLSLGSNAGNRRENLRKAMQLFCGEGIALRCTSSIYETEPVDNTDQGWFLNCVAEVSTTLEPLALLRKLQRIENQMGRERTVPKGPRTLDIDILLCGDVVLQSDELTLPHPRMLERRFVLEPLREIAPALPLPGTAKTVEEAFQQLRDPAQVRRLEPGFITIPG